MNQASCQERTKLVSVIEADLRQLAQDARRAEGFASFFSSTSSAPDVQKAAERVIEKLQNVSDFSLSSSDTLSEESMIALMDDVMQPLQLACGTTSSRLVAQSLVILQKLISNGIISYESAENVVNILSQIETISDENVQVKALQTTLILLQSPLHPTSEEGILILLGICFRASVHNTKSKTLNSTAAATIRQAVALVFSYVDIPAELARQKDLDTMEEKDSVIGTAEKNIPMLLLSGQLPRTKQDLSPQPALVASQHLLEDLIAIATGARPTWLKIPSLHRAVVLEILDFALDQNPLLFSSLPDFESTLSLRISQILQAQLTDYLDAGASLANLPASSAGAFRATLRCIRTVLLRYHSQLGGRAGTLIQTLLRGLGPPHPLSQRIPIAQLVRHLLADPSLVLHLFETFDSHKDRKLDAIHALVRTSADAADDALKSSSAGHNSLDNSSTKTGTKSRQDIFKSFSDPFEALDSLFEERAHGNTWIMDGEYESAPSILQMAYLAMISIDSLLLYADAVERLTNAATCDKSNGVVSCEPTDQNLPSVVDRSQMTKISHETLTVNPKESGIADNGVQNRRTTQSIETDDLANPYSISLVASRLTLRKPSLELGATLGPLPQNVEPQLCSKLVSGTWRAVLAVFSELLSASFSDSLITCVLKGHHSFTRACGVFELEEPRNEFIRVLCDLSLAKEDEKEYRSGDVNDSNYNSPRRATLNTNLGIRRTLSGEMEGDKPVSLSTKNVHIIRYLFLAVNSLSDVLGSAWAQVLETIINIDKILQSPKTTVADPKIVKGVFKNSDNGAKAVHSQEITQTKYSDDTIFNISSLLSSAKRLFEHTTDMRDEAVVALLAGLRDVSLQSLPNADQVSQTKLYAMERMVDVLLHNKNRVADLWTIFLSHVLEVFNDPRARVRLAAINALERAILGVLNNTQKMDDGIGNLSTNRHNLTEDLKSAIREPVGHHLEEKAPGKATEVSRADLEHMLLVALESIYIDHSQKEIRTGVLETVLSILQHQGEHLTEGWTPIFRLLAYVPESNSQDSSGNIDLGFESLQVIASEYLATLTFDQLKRCVEVSGLYGEQQANVNVSLTTITLLWNVTDMLGRSGVAAEDALAATHLVSQSASLSTDVFMHEHEDRDQSSHGADRPVSSSELSQIESEKSGLMLPAASSPASADELIRLIFSVLQSLSCDSRPEVRNSGVRTLFAVVVAQGPRLSRRLWEHALWELLFPLLRHAFHMSATSSKEETEAALIGQSRGEKVRFMVHHSRNTEQKQWDETVVVALGGMARLLRAHLPAIAAMEGMEGGWDELMIVIESSLAGGRKEVAVSAVQFLSSVLLAHGNDDTVISSHMWKRALRAIDVGVEAAVSAGCQVPLAARTELVNLIGDLYMHLHFRFDYDASISVFRWAEAFCRNPWSEDDAKNPVQSIGMPPVQKTALGLWIKLVHPLKEDDLWTQYLSFIIKLIDPTHVLANWEQVSSLHNETSHSEASNTFLQSNEATSNAMNCPTSRNTLSATPGPLGRGAADTPQPPLKTAQHRLAMNSMFLEKLVEHVLMQVYAQAPSVVQIRVFSSIMKALNQCMELRFLAYQDDVWRSAAAACNKIIPVGIDALEKEWKNSAFEQKEDIYEDCWVNVVALFQNFLLGAHWLSTRNEDELSELHDLNKEETYAGAREQDQQVGIRFQGAQKNIQINEGKLPTVPILDVPKSSKPKGFFRLSHSMPGISSVNNEKPKGKKTWMENASMSGGMNDTLNTDADIQNLDSSVDTEMESKKPVVDPERAREDAELELCILDTLTDVVLPGSGSATKNVKEMLVKVVDRGINRDCSVHIPQTLTGSNFGHVCVRKMYVLCTRATGKRDDRVNLEVARIALPLFLARCDTVLRSFVEDSKYYKQTNERNIATASNSGDSNEKELGGKFLSADFTENGHEMINLVQTRSEANIKKFDMDIKAEAHIKTRKPDDDRRILEEVICFLEVLASMSLAPAVADVVLPEGDSLTEVIRALRLRPDSLTRGRERSHLLLLYSSLCGCITCSDVRVREMIMGVLGLAGAELGLGGQIQDLLKNIS